MKNYYKITFISLCLVFVLNSKSEEVTEQIVIPPLFEYPVAPEELETLQEKTDYLMEHFWDGFDFKKEEAVDQNALNDAFSVYTSTMAYANPEKVKESVRKLVNNIGDNPVLSLQFTKSAEESLYGPRADIWIDDIYLCFLDNLVKNKRVQDNKKSRYKAQQRLLSTTKIGTVMPEFPYIKDGRNFNFKPQSEFTLIAFEDSECTDCRYTHLKMDISRILNDMLAAGKLQVYCALSSPLGEKTAKSADLSSKWNIIETGDLSGIIDLRFMPSFYVLDKDGKILMKNVTVDKAIDILENAGKQQKR